MLVTENNVQVTAVRKLFFCNFQYMEVHSVVAVEI